MSEEQNIESVAADSVGEGTLRDALTEAFSNKEPEEVVEEVSDNIDDSDEEIVEQEEVVGDIDYEAPKSWNQEELDALDVLMKAAPEQAKILLENRYNKIHSGFEEKSGELARYKQQYDGFGELFKEYEGQLSVAGLTPYDAVSRLVSVDKQLRADPESTIRELARINGVDLGNISGETESYEDDYTDPKVEELRATVESLQKQITQQTASAEQYQQSQIQETISSFAAKKDDEGNLQYPLFEKDVVKLGMKSYIDSGKADNLESAYNLVMSEMGLSSNAKQSSPLKTAAEKQSQAIRQEGLVRRLIKEEHLRQLVPIIQIQLLEKS